ncbi:hypothetical protein C8T65DRAFT_739799 [Cerioporus squamosus]|nr:hypothetical protein C8T65DRAFT_739799 [Cerioporus squamosus]
MPPAAQMGSFSSYDELYHLPYDLPDYSGASRNDSISVPMQWLMPQPQYAAHAVIPAIYVPQLFLLQGLPACASLIGVGFGADVAYTHNTALLPPAPCGNTMATQSLSDKDAGSITIRAPQPVYPISFDAILAECASNSSGEHHLAPQQSSPCVTNMASACVVDDHDAETMPVEFPADRAQSPPLGHEEEEFPD